MLPGAIFVLCVIVGYAASVIVNALSKIERALSSDSEGPRDPSERIVVPKCTRLIYLGEPAPEHCGEEFRRHFTHFG
jgi:hypothetical protein